MEKIDELFSEENETNQTPRRDSNQNKNLAGNLIARNQRIDSAVNMSGDNMRVLEDINEEPDENMVTDGH